MKYFFVKNNFSGKDYLFKKKDRVVAFFVVKFNVLNFKFIHDFKVIDDVYKMYYVNLDKSIIKKINIYKFMCSEFYKKNKYRKLNKHISSYFYCENCGIIGNCWTIILDKNNLFCIECLNLFKSKVD